MAKTKLRISKSNLSLYRANSSIGNEAIKTILNLFIFLREDSTHRKSTKRKTNNFHPLTFLNAQKIAAFVVFCLLIVVYEVFLCVNYF